MKLRNRHLIYPSRENLLAYKNIKKKCDNLLKQSKKKCIKDSNKGAATSKSFWNTVKPFITHKGIPTNENITIEVEKNEQVEVKGLHEKVDIRTKDLIKDEKSLVEMFNKHCNYKYCWGNLRNSSKKPRKPVGTKTRWKNYSWNYWKLSKSPQHH